jgi:hypothetical protein
MSMLYKPGRFNSQNSFISSVENNLDTFRLRAVFKVSFFAVVHNKDGNGKIKAVGRAEVVTILELE